MDNCEGCHGKCALVTMPHETNNCPCIQCLIKMVCYAACEEWINFFTGVADRRRREFKNLKTWRSDA